MRRRNNHVGVNQQIADISLLPRFQTPPNPAKESARMETTKTEISEPKHNHRGDETTTIKPSVHSESDAARTLQRTYRGYRSRRELRGFSLDPSTRWTEVLTTLSRPLVLNANFKPCSRLSKKHNIVLS